MNPQPVNLQSYLGQPSPLERSLRHLLKGTASPVIFDIGACEGEDSIRYSRLFPGARIFTFEPLPANQEIIRANLAKYGVSAELIPVALSDHRGSAIFHVSAGRPKDLFSGENWNYGNKSSSLLPPAAAEPMHGWIQFPERITVPCETLADVCAARGIDRIDFIHMDVQGAEGLVLEGAKAMLPRIRLIWLEVSNQELYQGQKLRSDLEAMLQRAGFALAYEESRGVEGDQFHINLRFGRNRLWLAGQRLRRLCSRALRRFLPKRVSPK
jgi:FkbM family methyltransferase